MSSMMINKNKKIHVPDDSKSNAALKVACNVSFSNEMFNVTPCTHQKPVWKKIPLFCIKGNHWDCLGSKASMFCI